MLHRSTSSRRRRPSRSVTNPSHSGMISTGPKGRRASVATEKPILLTQTSPRGTMDRQRSPRGSIVPNIALDTEGDSLEEDRSHRILPDLDQYGGSRNTLVPDRSWSSRQSLVPDDEYRSSRNCITPNISRSARNSLVPDVGRLQRHSLTPDMLNGSRHSLLPDPQLSPRNSLIPDAPHSRSPRSTQIHMTGSRTSLMPDMPEVSRSPRGSVANLEFVHEVSRSPRGSIAPLDMDRSPRGSIVSECPSQSPRGSIVPDNRSPRGSIVPEPNRSPRGSICPEGNRSPRGSIAPYDQGNRSPRGSIGKPDMERHSRGSICANEEDLQNEENEIKKARNHRGSIEPDVIDRSPRGSLGGLPERRVTKAKCGTYQDLRRVSADQGTTRNRSSSPYRQREITPGSIKSGEPGSSPQAFGESRRASSNVSQFSGDESRRLFPGGAKVPDKRTEPTSINVATYGSVVFQLKDANFEANSTCEFVFRAMRVVSKTTTVTICLACLCPMPILMFIFGLQFQNECPKEKSIPTYLAVGGAFGTVQMFLTLYSQIRSKRLEVLPTVPGGWSISTRKLISVVLCCFLLIWFGLGNYWILSIMWPPYTTEMYSPGNWCHKKLYIFSVVHLCVVYAVFLAAVIVAIGLASFRNRILTCSMPERYK